VGEIAVREDAPRLFARLVFPLTAKGLFANYMDKISLRFGSDLVVAISAKPQA
jgi:hypothetical protein